ncbi:MAG TPA: hypothetical protein VHC94_03950 [Nitrobacter sp.]|jgi:hypothetical protein|nr:hypothetical protein [Nitrobacter sp.]
MIANVLIALAAGCASALMFASIASGALISLVLFYLSPLPLMVAAMGWGPLTAALGGTLAALALGAIFSSSYGLAFALTIALPAWWLGHLALLGREVGPPSAPGAPPALEWYPLGRILIWIAAFAALTTIGALLTLGLDAATITATLRRGLLRILGVKDGTTPSSGAETVIDALIAMAPAAAAIITMLTLTLNLWLAGKVTATSGRLHRPWPDMKAAALPPLTLAALAFALAICFAGGLPAIMAQIVVAALMMAYALVGFAVLHTLTLALKARPLWLSCTYAIMLVFGWPVVAMAALGLADAIFGLRQRYLQRHTPPPLAPHP